MTDVNSIASIAARIERLPFGRFHRRFITLVSLGNFFDLYDIFVVAYIGAALQQSHFITLQQFTAFIASGFFGMFVGTIAFGIGSDRFGRRIVFMTLLLLYSIFTLACAFAPSATWLIVLRFFAGAGIGAEIIVIDTYVSEIVPSYASAAATSPSRRLSAFPPCPLPPCSPACSCRRTFLWLDGAGSF